MRTLTEVVALARSAGGLWWRNLTRMGFWFLAGFSAQLLANYGSVLLGGRFDVAATVIFVLGVIAVVAALILTIASCRPAHRAVAESSRTTLIVTIGPFLTAYALWGLLEDQISDLFVINVALRGLGGYETWSVNLSRIRFYVILALVAWAGRLVVSMLARRSRAGWLPIAAIVLEGIWVITSLLALFVLVRRAVTWLQGRAVWSWVSEVWYQMLAWLPDLRLPFDLTLPAAVDAAARWVWSTLLPGLSHAVLLPLMWLALTAVVLGWHSANPPAELVGRTPFADRTRRWHSRVATRTVTPVWRLVIGTGLLLTSDLRSKYLPVLGALALTLRVGWRFVGAYLIIATAVETLRRFAVTGVDWVIGPQPATLYLARMAVSDLAVGLVFTTLAVAVYVAASDRIMIVTERTRSSANRSAVPS